MGKSCRHNQWIPRDGTHFRFNYLDPIAMRKSEIKALIRSNSYKDCQSFSRAYKLKNAVVLPLFEEVQREITQARTRVATMPWR